MTNKETIFKKKNPSKLWKEGKNIKIKHSNGTIIDYKCMFDERTEKYLVMYENTPSEYALNIRLFNKMMLVGKDVPIYSNEEMRLKATLKFLDAKKKEVQALEVMRMTSTNIAESPKKCLTNIKGW